MRRLALLTLLALLPSPACTTMSNGSGPSAPVNTGSVAPGTSVSRGGKPVALSKGHLGLDQPLPQVALTDDNWDAYTFKGDGKVKLVSFVPSVDTRVCEQQTHLLGEAKGLDAKVQRVVVSRDLPAAQKRFELETALSNILYLSDYKTGAFAKEAGLMMEDSGLIARAVAVVDGQGKVRYLQVVPEVANLPDMAKAIQAANDVANAKSVGR